MILKYLLPTIHRTVVHVQQIHHAELSTEAHGILYASVTGIFRACSN